MIELEFFHQRGEYVIGTLPAGNPPVVPNNGDRADVPNAAGDGTYSYVTVSNRHFYYMPDGTITRIRLYCTEAG